MSPQLPRLIVDEPDFRIVETDITGSLDYVLEVRDGCDALGTERWRRFDTKGSKNLENIFKFLVRVALKGQE